jgi:hypothetical protein
MPGLSEGLLGSQECPLVLDAPTNLNERIAYYSLLQEDGQKSTNVLLPDSLSTQTVFLLFRIS